MILPLVVPVPDLPPEPEPMTFSSPFAITLGALGLIVATVFVVRVIRVEFGHPQTLRSLRTSLLLCALFVTLIGGMVIVDTAQRRARDQQIDAWRDLRRVAAREMASALENAYGFTFDRSTASVPVVQQDWVTDQPVTLADGTPTTCWFATTDGHYTVMCGDTEETATPLQPVSP
ncbi:hypothetical protein [Cellulomonas iranensis]|uniref:Uncharacterized protein n=1 Tax=Cellulomonas iranensis TaxID=76862 RepID=A0ABU0GHR6_9CELL|nr:hypothetical protein [Cellulomonas iranensis]MDQ0424858.1 hypothetical protein [Cellulomonas iranensis]